MPDLLILAGPNGAGKTTAAKTLLPEFTSIVEFVNADEIARGLSPFNPEGVALQAGRIMLKRMDELIAAKVSFAFETTLSGRTYVKTIQKCQKAGYRVNLLFVYLPSPDIAKTRVLKRVSEGGHNIPPEVIERRHAQGIRYLVQHYMHVVDECRIVSGQTRDHTPIYLRLPFQSEIIYDQEAWSDILELCNEQSD